MNTREFFARVKAIRDEMEQSHPEGAWLLNVSPQAQPLAICHCPPSVAAVNLALGTHRQATNKEIADFQAKQDAICQKHKDLYIRRNQQFFNIVPRESGKNK